MFFGQTLSEEPAPTTLRQRVSDGFENSFLILGENFVLSPYRYQVQRQVTHNRRSEPCVVLLSTGTLVPD